VDDETAAASGRRARSRKHSIAKKTSTFLPCFLRDICETSLREKKRRFDQLTAQDEHKMELLIVYFTRSND
jgi:hypothetical protein